MGELISKKNFFRRFLKKKYHNQGMVQFEADGSGKKMPTICGDEILWLDELVVEAFTEKKADKMCFKILNEKYPQYKGYIQLW